MADDSNPSKTKTYSSKSATSRRRSNKAIVGQEPLTRLDIEQIYNLYETKSHEEWKIFEVLRHLGHRVINTKSSAEWEIFDVLLNLTMAVSIHYSSEEELISSGFFKSVGIFAESIYNSEDYSTDSIQINLAIEEVKKALFILKHERHKKSGRFSGESIFRYLEYKLQEYLKSKSFSSDSVSDNLDAPEFLNPRVEEIGEIDEGSLRRLEKEQRIRHLTAYFDVANVPKRERAALIEKFEIDTARVTRPKWVGRLERGGELAALSAPLFLKRVHADYIGSGGTVENEIIRAIDPDLMRAVESYISKRKKNNSDLGDAEGLDFVLTRPGKGNASKTRKADEITP